MTYDEYKAQLLTVANEEEEINLHNSYSMETCRVNTQESFEIALIAHKKAELIFYKRGLAESKRTMGNCYLLFGDYKNSIIEIENSLLIFQQIEDRIGEAESLNLYGNLFSQMGNYDSAIAHYEISLEIMVSTGNNMGQVKVMNSIGDSLIHQRKYKTALRLFKRISTIEYDSEVYKGVVLYNVSEVYYHLNQFEEAEKNLLVCLKMGRDLKYDLMYLYCSWLKGRIESKKGNFNNAIRTLQSALQKARRIKAKDREFNILEDLAKNYELKGDFEQSLKYYKAFLRAKEQVINEESAKIIKTMEHKNEVLFFKRETEIEKTKNIELTKAYSEIEERRKEILNKNKEITDSIRYAKRIQEAILPSDDLIQQLLPNSFIIYQPKAILSGDFYWISEVTSTITGEKLILIAVADCTGHGVPGALLSIVGNNFLRLCTSEQAVQSSADALNFLNEGLCNTLHQRPEETTIKDGMDITFIAINRSKMEVSFAGAKNPLYIIRKGQLIEIKGDKHPVGAFMGEELKPFTEHKIQLYKNDQLYLFTDGYADQFGGIAGKKFKYKAFKQLLLSLAHLPMNSQRKSIVSTFQKWKGNLEQVDDVCLFSCKI